MHSIRQGLFFHGVALGLLASASVAYADLQNVEVNGTHLLSGTSFAEWRSDTSEWVNVSDVTLSHDDDGVHLVAGTAPRHRVLLNGRGATHRTIGARTG